MPIPQRPILWGVTDWYEHVVAEGPIIQDPPSPQITWPGLEDQSRHHTFTYLSTICFDSVYLEFYQRTDVLQAEYCHCQLLPHHQLSHRDTIPESVLKDPEEVMTRRNPEEDPPTNLLDKRRTHGRNGGAY
ncbi:hypothetical protein Tco_1002740 [Tanacetum coccineum]|uniref:Uncharacterized protein n=1 Tax=Tanacetum coccineum TaxID=301880 RepID=A0ABQ5F7E0_9ASTR